MDFESLPETAHCPVCGAEIRQDVVACPACGAPITESGNPTSPDLREELKLLVEKVNQNLQKAGAGAAEYAFGLGCSLGGLFSGLILVVIFVMGIRNWIVLSIVALGGGLITTGIATILSSRARTATISTTYDRSVKREIESFINRHQITWSHFDILADQMLGKDDPLRRYLSLSVKQAHSNHEE